MSNLTRKKSIIIAAFFIIVLVSILCIKLLTPSSDESSATISAKKVKSDNQGNTEPNSQPNWELTEQGKQYEIYYSSNTYEAKYKIFNKEGEIVADSQKDDMFLKDVSIKYISDDILSIQWGAGTYVNLVEYYNTATDQLSECYQNPYTIFDEKVVYYSGGKLIVENIFYPGNMDYREYPCDFSSYSHPSSVKLNKDKTKLTITHFKSDGETEVTRSFELRYE